MNSNWFEASRTKLAISFVLVLLLLPVLPAQAADITVDSGCDLEEAINEANDSSNADTGDCDTGDSGTDTILLSEDVDLTNGHLPTITSTIIIDGAACNSDSSGNCIVDGGDTYRLFEVRSGGNLTVQNLVLNDGGPNQGPGGAIRVHEGALTVDNVIISNSTAKATSARGGGIFMRSAATSLTVKNSTITGNSVQNKEGGGIAIAAESTGSVTITNTTISGNSANEEGGGIFIGENYTGTATISGSTIHDNEADDGGGGLYLGSGSTVTIQKNAFTENSAITSKGGGILSYGTLTLENSTFSANEVTGLNAGGSIYIGGGTATIKHITVAGSSAPNAGTGGGIALHHTGATLHLYNNILAGSGTLCGGNGTISSNLGNLIQGGSCSPALSSDPLLGTLTGSPAYFPLGATSPAIDAGDETNCLADDQRGNARTAASCDIGAIEQADGGGATTGGIQEPAPLPVTTSETTSETNTETNSEAARSGTASSGSSGSSAADSDEDADDEEAPVQTCEILMQETDITVTDISGLGIGYQCQRADATAVGDARVIAMGLVDAVDVWGWIAQGIELCFPQSAAAVFLDAAHAPRTLHSLESYTNGAGMTCVEIDRAGTIALVEGTPTYSYLPPKQLSNCMVFTRNILNFRETPDGEITGLIPALVTLTAMAHTPGWYEVDYWGDVGWISADYVEPQGDCGA